MSELTATDVAIEQIIKAGFSHIKVELEADLGRDGERRCEYCDDGYVTCDSCDGDGVVMAERPNGTEIEVECDDCYGEGHTDCDECDGGYDGGYYDEDYCEQFMRDYVGSEVLSRLTYGNFYEDGSVDSEFTFTVPATAYKDVVVWIEAFKALADDIGNGYETHGAGMHISVIPDYSGGNYPVRQHMPEEKIENFKRQMSKLIPAMMFFSSNNKVSRDLGYRRPQVSDDDKYSAIFTHHDTCIEYRAFETCYDNPEDIFQHFEVVAKTLEFYANPSKRVTVQEFNIDSGSGREVSRFYRSPEKIKALRQQVRHLKPSGKTIKECFEQRDMFTVTELKRRQSKRRGELRKEYYRAKARIAELDAMPMTEEMQARYESIKREAARGYYGSMSEAEMLDQAKGINRLPTINQYIEQHLNRF